MKNMITMTQLGKIRLLHYQRLRMLLLLLLITVAAVSVIYKPNSQLKEHKLRRLTTVAIPEDIKHYDIYIANQDIESSSEIIIPLEKRKKHDDIRYASFGSSVTWGAGLDDREHEAYAWRLSEFDYERAKNYGIRATGPNYPAACISSMIGEHAFDVIVLEYFLRGPEGLMTFALRLRERFPNAIIVMTKLWGPYQFRDYSININVADWANGIGFERDFIHDPQFRKAVLAHGADKFKYQYSSPESEVTKLHAAVADKIGAHVVQMPFSNNADGPGGWLELGDELLARDSFHLSAKGHEVLADQIKAIVDRIGVPRDTVLGNFHGVDHCHNWFESGVIGEGLEYSANGILDKMKNTDKYVLSFDNDKVNNITSIVESGWIKISNPSDAEMDLFVAYMTTGPPPSKYPRVEVTRSDRYKTKYLLEPESIGWGDRYVHIARIGHIGTIHPGVLNEMITFKPLEEAEYPFRLVAIVITPINKNSQEEFTGIGG